MSGNHIVVFLNPLNRIVVIPNHLSLTERRYVSILSIYYVSRSYFVDGAKNIIEWYSETLVMRICPGMILNWNWLWLLFIWSKKLSIWVSKYTALHKNRKTMTSYYSPLDAHISRRDSIFSQSLSTTRQGQSDVEFHGESYRG